MDDFAFIKKRWRLYPHSANVLWLNNKKLRATDYVREDTVNYFTNRVKEGRSASKWNILASYIHPYLFQGKMHNKNGLASFNDLYIKRRVSGLRKCLLGI